MERASQQRLRDPTLRVLLGPFRGPPGGGPERESVCFTTHARLRGPAAERIVAIDRGRGVNDYRVEPLKHREMFLQLDALVGAKRCALPDRLFGAWVAPCEHC